ncbi:MAG: helix-turn-helix domain-containing protein [Candidatus Eremiobacteraeota bacterium]|nr:helix-turn-helix domain-containing protein [Candidatus Eremiobacteraeota bacterium]
MPVRTQTPPTSDELVEFAEALARIASSGGGAKALAAHLASTLNAAILVEDADWRHVALAGAGSRTVPASSREMIASAGQAVNGVAHLPSASEAVEGLAVRIRAGDSTLGWLSAFPKADAVGERLPLLRLTAATIAVEMARDAGSGKSRQKSFWDRLLARAYDDPIEARDDAASRGISLANAYVAVAVEAEGLDETNAPAKAGDLRRIALETLRSGSGDIVALERGGGLVFLCPAPLEVDAQNVRTAATLIPRAATKAHFGARVLGGVGRAAEAIDAHRTVEEARESLFIARRLFGGSRVMPYDDLGIYPLLLRGGTSAAQLREFSQRILAPLRAYDDKHQTELVRTLRLYFEVGQNVKTAAGELSVHRHTVFYRLRQIADITSLDLDGPHDQLTLRTAMAIDALNPHER